MIKNISFIQRKEPLVLMDMNVLCFKRDIILTGTGTYFTTVRIDYVILK